MTSTKSYSVLWKIPHLFETGSNFKVFMVHHGPLKVSNYYSENLQWVFMSLLLINYLFLSCKATYAYSIYTVLTHVRKCVKKKSEKYRTISCYTSNNLTTPYVTTIQGALCILKYNGWKIKYLNILQKNWIKSVS